ncbi:hypothetical protein [Legionella worsleiensis]|uniref:Dot/Icm T4SS effector n=1 Tax=Legionella worsleiensis TaxID=45076 RepID=A0A0W1A644_9GAMM|nr:hypothetical protein [Legionella worsleiensis]KTD76813.1 Dot/Icm T4SS effector [Legionella worsleiensis]STY30669.1 Dot/Icm T4SS effector [Legionella worsleiensis]
MPNPSVFLVDNTGNGNCMYHSYSISLMYYLRSKNDPEITETVFNNIGLNEEEKRILMPIITTNRHQKIPQEQIRTIIEPMLAAKIRALGARQTKIEFIKNPVATGVFSSAKYGIEHYFRQTLRSLGSQLISVPLNNSDLRQAEIYRVKDITQKMAYFAHDKTQEVYNQFRTEWNKVKNTVKEADIHFRQTQIMDDILKNKTVEFFSLNNYANLDAYIEYLSTDKVWGSEETLFTIHRAVQGEYSVRDEKGDVEIRHQTAINLQILRNGIAVQEDKNPEIILNNSGNIHWNSYIPENVFNPQQAYLAQLEDQRTLSDEEKALELQRFFDTEEQQIRQDQALAEELQRRELEIQRKFDAQLQLQLTEDQKAAEELIKNILRENPEYAELILAKEVYLNTSDDAAVQNSEPGAQQAVDEAQTHAPHGPSEAINIAHTEAQEIADDEALAQQMAAEEETASAQRMIQEQHSAALALSLAEEESAAVAQRLAEEQESAAVAQRLAEEQESVAVAQRLAEEQGVAEEEPAAALAQQISESQHNPFDGIILSLDEEMARQMAAEEEAAVAQRLTNERESIALAQQLTQEQGVAVEAESAAALDQPISEPQTNPFDGIILSLDEEHQDTLNDEKLARILAAEESVALERRLAEEQQHNTMISSNQPDRTRTGQKVQMDSEVEDAIKKFEKLLSDLGRKIKDLEKRQEEALSVQSSTYSSLVLASLSANTLHEELTSELSKYESNPTKEQYLQFKNTCKSAINLRRPVLEQHRGFKQLLGNIALAVLGLGVIYLAAAAVNKAITGNFLFFKTDSAVIVDKIQNSLDEIESVQNNPKK